MVSLQFSFHFWEKEENIQLSQKSICLRAKHNSPFVSFQKCEAFDVLWTKGFVDFRINIKTAEHSIAKKEYLITAGVDVDQEAVEHDKILVALYAVR